MRQIPYGRQDVTADDIFAVTEILSSGLLTQGPTVPAFEKALELEFGAQFATVLNSATSALHVACLALGVGPNDLVWTSAITFVASSNSALYCGAQVDFVDVDPISYNMSTEHLREKLSVAESKNKLPKVVIPVHLTGQPCDMKEIFALSRQYGFKVIEDASHAVGATYKNVAVGNCAFSDVVVFSFHPVKIITTGEGGAALTNDEKLASKMRLLRSHGITRNKSEFRVTDYGDWYYEQSELGFNYRMTDFQAALGISQLIRLPHYLLKRNELAKKYNSAFSGKGLGLPIQNPDSKSSWHLYVIRVQAEVREEMFSELRRSGILVNLHYMPVYRHPYYQRFGYEFNDFPNSEKYFREALSIPLYPTLSEQDQNFVIDQVLRSLRI